MNFIFYSIQQAIVFNLPLYMVIFSEGLQLSVIVIPNNVAITTS